MNTETVSTDVRSAPSPGEPLDPLFQAVAQATFVALALVDREMRILHLNENAARITGIEAKLAVGQTVDALWPQMGPHFRAAGAHCLETGEPVRGSSANELIGLKYDVLPARRDGTIDRFVILAYANPPDDAQGDTSDFARERFTLVNVLSRLARMTPETCDAVMTETLGTVAADFQCDRALVRVLTDDGNRFAITHRYDAPSLPHLTSEEDRSGAHTDLLERYADGETLVFPSLESIPPQHAAVRGRMERVGCRAACGVPMADGGRLLGRVAFLSVKERQWSESVKARLRLYGEVLGTAYSRVRAELALRERLQFEEALATASSRLMDVAPGALDAELTRALEAATTALGMDRTVLSLLDAARERFVMTHEWCAPGVPSFQKYAGSMPIAAFGWPLTRVIEGETINLTVATLPPDAVNARRVVDVSGIRATVIVPLTLHGDVIGCVQFHSLRRDDRIPAELIARLRVIGDVLGSALARRRAAESLHESELRFTQVIESAPDGVVVLDASGVVLEWTPQTEQLFGRLRHEVVGRRFTDVALDPKDHARFVSPGDTLTSEARVELAGLRSDGRSLPLELSIAPMKRAGAPIFALFVRDITDRRRAEQERQRAFDEVARQRTKAERERDYLREEVGHDGGHDAILGRSPAILRALESLEAVASTTATVLVHGESGVGKELFARAIHAQSKRAAGALVKVNCASIPESLFESEFFGHVRGSFTGAHKDRVGRFELADGGTLFLDEVGEIPLEMQAKLLRVLQEGEFERVGDDRTRRVDVRVVAATNRDLVAEVQAGRFRRDLYYRLSVFPIDVPPLRDRADDIVPLAQHFLSTMARSAGRTGLELTPEHKTALLDYDWPGNIRELQHVIERAVIVSATPPLRLHLATTSAQSVSTPQSAPRMRAAEGAILTDEELRKLERDNIVAALDKAGGRISGGGGAAEILKVNPSTLRDRMKALGVGRRA